MGAVLRRARVQPQHQGAGRLLGRAVHGRGRAAGAGRAHPGAPRLDAGVGGGRDRALRPRHRRLGRVAAGEQVILNDPFAGGTHLNDITLVAACFVDGRLVGWVANRAHHADVGGAAPGSMPADATEIFAEGLRLPPVRLTDEVRARAVRQLPHARRARGDLDAQVGANAVGVERLAALAGRARSTRCWPTASAACGPRWPPCPTARGASPTWSTRSAPPRAAGRDPRARSRCAIDGRHDHLRLHRHATRSAPATSTRCEAVTVSAVGLRPALRRSTRRCRPTAARSARSRVLAAAGHDRRRPARRPRSAPATSRSASGSPTSASARSAQALPGRLGARLAGDDEQRAHRAAPTPTAGRGCTTRPSPAGRAAGCRARA